MSTQLPQQLLHSLRGVAGYDEQEFIHAHENTPPPVSLRFNPAKFAGNVHEYFPGAVKVPWSSHGYYLPSRPSFTLDPMLHAGVYYVQEASSMFIEQCFIQHADLTKPLRVLDLCAAPGGKSTLIQSVLPQNGLLVSNEIIKSRVNVLSENLTKWGSVNVIVTNNDPEDFNRLPSFFDALVVDAPCSGSGLFRRDAAAIQEWSEEAVQICSMRQQRILTSAFDTLREGGLLVYSTCSYSHEENEGICDWLMEHFSVQPLRLSVSGSWNIVEAMSAKGAAAYRFFPHKTSGEGFFVACFRKIEPVEAAAIKKRKLQEAGKKDAELIRSWTAEGSNVDLYEHQGTLFAFPEDLEEDLAAIHANLYVKKAGVRIGKMLRDELLPDHELAVSDITNRNLPSVLLNKDDALQYLRKKEVTVNSNNRGWVLVRYDKWNLGWIKLLGNRSNNYYPKEWRILKS